MTLSQVHRDVRGDWLRACEPSCAVILRSAVKQVPGLASPTPARTRLWAPRAEPGTHTHTHTHTHTLTRLDPHSTQACRASARLRGAKPRDSYKRHARQGAYDTATSHTGTTTRNHARHSAYDSTTVLYPIARQASVKRDCIMMSPRSCVTRQLRQRGGHAWRERLRRWALQLHAQSDHSQSPGDPRVGV